MTCVSFGTFPPMQKFFVKLIYSITVWKSTLKYDHDFLWKVAIFFRQTKAKPKCSFLLAFYLVEPLLKIANSNFCVILRRNSFSCITKRRGFKLSYDVKKRAASGGYLKLLAFENSHFWYGKTHICIRKFEHFSMDEF